MNCWVITCEHGGRQLPAVYRPLFRNAGSVLDSHRGYDAGALFVYNKLLPLADYHQHNLITRLLIDFNRSQNHPHCFSQYTRELSRDTKQEILRQYYLPYRTALEQVLSDALQKQRQIIHISVHSFTPELDGQIRTNAIGLLYDPSRTAEKQFCTEWRRLLQQKAPGRQVRFNYPYRGSSDGLTTALRRQFGRHYLGIELEINQLHLKQPAKTGRILRESLEELQHNLH